MTKPHIVEYEDLKEFTFEQILASGPSHKGLKKLIAVCDLDEKDEGFVYYHIEVKGVVVHRTNNLELAVESYNEEWW